METALLIFVWIYSGLMINFMYSIADLYPIRRTKHKLLFGLLFSVFGLLNILIIPIIGS
jgi:hypothetical protein